MGFSCKIKEDALVASGRHCCICHKFCGLKIEIHHIKLESEGGSNLFENAIALCFDCHSDMRSTDHKHPKGTKYTESELKRHRDSWYKKVKNNVGIANKEQIIESDKLIFKIILEILPNDGSINFLRINNFAGFSFNTGKLNDIKDFVYKSDNPAFEFIDPDLEGLKLQLLDYSNKFLNVIAYETFPLNDQVRSNTVPPEWELEQPERFNRVVKEIHENKNKICEVYDILVKTGIRKLGFIPEGTI